jgi:hypothetical protein
MDLAKAARFRAPASIGRLKQCLADGASESGALRIVADPQAQKHRIQHEKYVREGSLPV